ncbi:porin family protein [Haliscomenobacter sp.]|uniref:porin family protein n=1 Tax=Haliscomenobacter sp. TaxID=2717303 RepID=UPI003594637E
MKNTFFLAAALFLALISGTNAQSTLHVGVRSGLQMSTIKQSELLSELTPKADYIYSNTTAAFAELDFGGNFSVQAELGYAGRGFGYDLQKDVKIGDFEIPLGARADFRFNTLELPVLFKAKSGLDAVRFYAQVGPYLGYNLNSKLIARTSGIIEIKLFEMDIDLDAVNYNRLEVGGIAGAGMEVNTGIGRFFLDGRYQHGFTANADIPVVQETFRSRGFAVQAGFALPLN